MSEREITFSQDEKEQIGYVARQAASAGEDFVYDLVRTKLHLIQLAFSWHDTLELKILYPELKHMVHEIDVMGEIVRQARAIMQFEGKDSLSLLDEQVKAAGLGSVFDPTSEISKKITKTEQL